MCPQYRCPIWQKKQDVTLVHIFVCPHRLVKAALARLDSRAQTVAAAAERSLGPETRGKLHFGWVERDKRNGQISGDGQETLQFGKVFEYVHGLPQKGGGRSA